MALTNKAKLEEAEKQIGRYQKKVADLKKENERLSNMLKDKQNVFIKAAEAVRNPLIQAILDYGEDATDPDTGEIIPRMKRLSISNFADKNFSEYEMRSRYDAAADKIVIALGLKDDPADSGKETEKSDGTNVS